MRLICSDEAYFCLTELVNKQNNRLWLSTRPTEGIERPLYDQYWFGVPCQAKGFMDHNFLKVLLTNIAALVCLDIIFGRK